MSKTFVFASPASCSLYTLSLHDALPICFFDVEDFTAQRQDRLKLAVAALLGGAACGVTFDYVEFAQGWVFRSEEHTSELQSRGQLVCRLLLVRRYNGQKIAVYGVMISFS